MKKFLYIIMCGVLLLSGCEEDNEPLAYPPTLASGSVTEMTRVQAVLSGAAIPHPSSIVKCDIGFMVATSDNMADAESFVGTEESDGSNQYQATATGLKPGTQYYFCIYAKSGNTLVKGPVQSFTTEESIAPIVSVPTVISKDETTLTLSSQVTDDGDDTPTIRGFAYKIYIEGDPDPTKSDNVVLGSLTATRGKEDPFTGTAINLQSNTTYAIRAYATNKTGTGYSQVITLRTDELMTPIVTIAPPNPDKLTSYTLEVTGTVTDERGYPVQERGFCWSAENRLPVVIENGQNQVTADETSTFTKVVTGLNSKTKYYLRAYATNEKGTGYSSPIEFATVEEQTASLTKMIVSDITSESAVLSALVATGIGAEIREKGFCYGREHNPTKADNPQPFNGESDQMQTKLTALEEGVTYYARAYATTRDDTFYSNEVEFTTSALLVPEIGNPVFKNVTETSATITAVIISNGGSEVQERGIYYSLTNQNPEQGGANVQTALSESTDPGKITVNLTGLTGGQRYYVKAFARNSKGTGYCSAPATLLTAANTAPKVSSLTVMNIQDDNAKAKAFVSDAGGNGLTIIERGFVWSNNGITPTLENNTGKIVASGSTDSFEALLNKLDPSTSYMVRAYAKNNKVQEAGYSQPISFMTGQTYAPTLTEGRRELVKFDRITISAVIANDGGATVTDYGICWAPAGETPDIEGNHAKGVMTGNTFTATATGLTHSTSYSIAAYAKNKDRNGVSYFYFGDITTAALPPQPDDNPTPDEPILGKKPSMNGVYNSGTFPTKLVITSGISDKGNSNITAQGFVWSTTEQNPEIGKTGCTVISITPGEELKTVLTGLAPGTTYYIRSYATNDVGTGYSNTARLTTEPGDKVEPGEGDNPTPEPIDNK